MHSSDDSIYRNIDNIEFDIDISNRIKSSKNIEFFDISRYLKKYRDISEISRYFLIYRDIFRHTLIVFQGKLRNSRRTVNN